MKRKIIISIGSILAIAIVAALALKHNNPTRPLESYLPSAVEQTKPAQTTQNEKDDKSTTVQFPFVGPRDGVPKDASKEQGFWSFAYPVPGVLSRSGQPTIEEFQWLKNNGWKSVIDLRPASERGGTGSDAKIPGFNELGFNYLELPIPDGSAPTNEQGEKFLSFVTDPKNQPVHIHCHAGVGRAGTMTALYRYSVQGWTIKKTIQESRAFRAGVSKSQRAWLLEWAQNHTPGSYK